MARFRPTLVGARLKAARERAGLSQGELASRAGIHRMTVTRLETGRRTGCTLDTVERLAEALSVRVADLTDEYKPAALEPLLREYLDSPWRLIDKPQDDELDWLRSLGSMFWNEVPPTPETVHEIIQLRRKNVP